MNHVKDVVYKGHELVVIEDTSAHTFMVDVRADNYDGVMLAGYTDFKTPDDAVRAGQIFIDGYQEATA